MFSLQVMTQNGFTDIDRINTTIYQTASVEITKKEGSSLIAQGWNINRDYYFVQAIERGSLSLHRIGTATSLEDTQYIHWVMGGCLGRAYFFKDLKPGVPIGYGMTTYNGNGERIVLGDDYAVAGVVRSGLSTGAISMSIGTGPWPYCHKIECSPDDIVMFSLDVGQMGGNLYYHQGLRYIAHSSENIEYYIIRPTGFVRSGKWGLQTFNDKGEMLYDSNNPIIDMKKSGFIKMYSDVTLDVKKTDRFVAASGPWRSYHSSSYKSKTPGHFVNYYFGMLLYRLTETKFVSNPRVLHLSEDFADSGQSLYLDQNFSSISYMIASGSN